MPPSTSSSIRGTTGHTTTRRRPATSFASLRGALVPSSPEARVRQVLAVPLPRRPLFPGVLTPVTVDNPRLVERLLDLKRDGGQAYVGAFLRRDGDAVAASAAADAATAGGVLSTDDLHPVGTLASVHTLAAGDGGAQLLLLGHRRVRSTRVIEADPLTLAITHLRDGHHDPDADELRATAMETVATLKELLTLHPLYNEQLKSFASLGGDFHDAGRLAEIGASLTSAPGADLQAVLEETDVPARAAAALLLLKKEVDLCRLQADIGRRVEEKISKDQRRYFLMEQLKSIKKELGLEKDDKAALAGKFRERLAERGGKVPPAVAAVIEDELAKLATLEPASSEFNVTRTYLDWLTALPWGEASVEKLDVDAARTILDADHHGLADVKDRVLEFIAVGALRGGTAGKILCLVGPPGVGKTSVGRSIARALGRAYYRFSVGGLGDVAEIKGHRRTYVGAMPGKVVQCLKSVGVEDPLLLIDEIDKLGRGHSGDPASALLELLDPEQNSGFVDHYLDVPLDLSRVLFVCTANSLDTIPGPLLDRMEVIRIPGYIASEKVAIARGYLEPAARRDAGVPDGAVVLDDGAVKSLVDDYCREAGVRNLKNTIDKVYRKAARKLVESGCVSLPPVGGGGAEKKSGDGGAADTTPAAATYTGPPITVTASDLPDYVGAPPFASDKLYDDGGPRPAGVVAGLAWTPLGGAALFVEAAVAERAPGKGSLTATGALGDVMKESATIAHTVARARFAALVGGGAGALPGLDHTSATALAAAAANDPSFFTDAAIHVHVPAGATPKDGPSAGVTLTTALLSLALGTPAAPDLAMTGEVTLTGRLLPVGGIKEKVIAAKRAGVARVALPEANRRDWDELAADVKEGIVPSFHTVYDTVFAAAFGGGGEEVEAAAAG
jgi:ATP-dependent Lon protease